MLVPKKRKFLAVGNQAQTRFQGNEEIEMVYLERDKEATRPSLTCDGVVCIPEPNWVSVLNPSTGEFLRFCSGPFHYENHMSYEGWWSEFNINSAMGFGKDEVNGKYKVVSMLFDHNHYQILDVDIGQWRKLVPPPYKVETRSKSACVKGSIYWLDLFRIYKLLALDLHTEEFRDVQVLPPILHSAGARIVNLDDRLAIADICMMKPGWNLEIWIMDAQEETWSMTYSQGRPWAKAHKARALGAKIIYVIRGAKLQNISLV
ncbi:F-box associated ubiquitination effector family protein [Raphanus sativus]|nr:F-box associated ubiquitination effector family protein [Raphanus sativus]